MIGKCYYKQALKWTKLSLASNLFLLFVYWVCIKDTTIYPTVLFHTPNQNCNRFAILKLLTLQNKNLTSFWKYIPTCPSWHLLSKKSLLFRKVWSCIWWNHLYISMNIFLLRCMWYVMHCWIECILWDYETMV